MKDWNEIVTLWKLYKKLLKKAVYYSQRFLTHNIGLFVLILLIDIFVKLKYLQAFSYLST